METASDQQNSFNDPLAWRLQISPPVAQRLPLGPDELRHADMLAARIIQLGGTPVTDPKKWYDVSGCGYEAPEEPFVATIVEQNIKGERCAIGYYKKLLELPQPKDPVTYNVVLQILQDEVAHEEDLQSLAEDLAYMLKK